MHQLDVQPLLPKTVLDLEHTSRVSRDHDIGLHHFYILYLSIK